MQPFAVIFDMDGLMLDTEPMARSAWTRALAEHGFMLDQITYLNMVGRTLRDAHLMLIDWFGPEIPFEQVYQKRQAYYDADIATNGIAVKPGLLELLEFLEEKKIPKAVASSTAAWFVAVKLKRAGIDGYFSTVVGGDEVAHGKPAPDLFLEAARQLGFAPEQCLALEDSEAGIQAAYRAGMLPFMVPDLKPPSMEVQGLVYAILPSLHDAKERIALFLESGWPR